jgi:glycine/D-amino acid oxidase-like deaminating enzyme
MGSGPVGLGRGGGPVGLGRGGDLDHDSDQKAWRHLEQHIAWLWPHLSGVAIIHRWGPPFSVTMDLTLALGYPGRGPHRGLRAGLHRHGVAMSYLNGEVLADLLTSDGDGGPPGSARSSTGG